MSPKYDKNRPNNRKNKNMDKDDTDEGGSGQGSNIQYRDFTEMDTRREDQLPPDELKRLLSIHQDAQEDRVKKQKELRDVRKAQKEGKKAGKEYGQGLSAGMQSQYPPHPILSEKLKGADPQVNPNPNDNMVQTNEANRDELQNKYQLRHQPQLANRPKFNPTPQR